MILTDEEIESAVKTGGVSCGTVRTDMKTINTSDLTGAALDWAVAKCEGEKFRWQPEFNGIGMEFEAHHYSTDWAQGGPIIEREGITVSKTAHGFWEAHKRPASVQECYQVHDTPLIAAMRCYAASKLGEEVEVPDELI